MMLEDRHFMHSTLRERIVEHVFVGYVLRHALAALRKQSPASKPSKKSLLRADLDRAGRPDFADAPINSANEYKTSNKFQEQSAFLKRRGETQYADGAHSHTALIRKWNGNLQADSGSKV